MWNHDITKSRSEEHRKGPGMSVTDQVISPPWRIRMRFNKYITIRSANEPCYEKRNGVDIKLMVKQLPLFHR